MGGLSAVPVEPHRHSLAFYTHTMPRGPRPPPLLERDPVLPEGAKRRRSGP